MGSERLRAHGAGNHKLFTVLTTGEKRVIFSGSLRDWMGRMAKKCADCKHYDREYGLCCYNPKGHKCHPGIPEHETYGCDNWEERKKETP